MGSPQIKGAMSGHLQVRRTWLFKVKLVNSVMRSLPAHKNTPIEV